MSKNNNLKIESPFVVNSGYNNLIYHANCPDGFGAAFSFWKRFKDEMEYIPLYHNNPVPSMKNKVVYMADICFDTETMLRVNDEAVLFQVLDHHISAKKRLDEYDFCYFDLEHSGAVLAWNYVFPDEKVPLILRYVEDRDLWKHNLPFSAEVLSVIDSYPKNFESWDELSNRLEEPSEFGKIVQEGASILRYKDSIIKSLYKNVYKMNIKGYDVPVVNAPFFKDEIVSKLAKSSIFAAGYHYDGQSYYFSLRSSGGFDVSLVAEELGGGGHKAASAFRIKDLKELG